MELGVWSVCTYFHVGVGGDECGFTLSWGEKEEEETLRSVGLVNKM